MTSIHVNIQYLTSLQYTAQTIQHMQQSHAMMHRGHKHGYDATRTY
jgi:hypothetical protein